MCVQGSTNGIPILFKVLPMVPMVMPMVPLALPMVSLVILVSQWYHWPPMVLHVLVKLPMVLLGESRMEPLFVFPKFRKIMVLTCIIQVTWSAGNAMVCSLC